VLLTVRRASNMPLLPMDAVEIAPAEASEIPFSTR
jgi:hypothetical protein